MSRLRQPARRRNETENTIPLINVVFLLLVFFLVAGTLSAPRDNAVELAETETFQPAPLDPLAIYVDASGALRVGGENMDAARAIARLEALDPTATQADALTVVPDRNLEARGLLKHLATLRDLTDRPIRVVTLRTIGGE